MVNIQNMVTSSVHQLVVGSDGATQILTLPLNENEQNRFNNSFDTLVKTINENLGDIIDLD